MAAHRNFEVYPDGHRQGAPPCSAPTAQLLGHRKQIMALLAVGGLGVAGAGLMVVNSYRKVMASFDSKGVEHILNEDDREKLRAENESKIKECAGPTGMRMSMMSSLHALKVHKRSCLPDIAYHFTCPDHAEYAAKRFLPLIVGSTHPLLPGEAAPNPSVWRVGSDGLREKINLCSLPKAGRPFVLNFGSVCDLHMGSSYPSSSPVN